MTDEAKIEVDDVVQLDPAADQIFGGCCFIVTSVSGGYVAGYTRFAQREAGVAYHRWLPEQCKYVGTLAYRLDPLGQYGQP